MSISTETHAADVDTDTFVTATLDGVATEVREVPSKKRRRRVRDLLRPEANGDQDAW